MGAPKGNEFWKLRAKHGRDKIFSTPDDLWIAATEYFQSVVDNPIIAQDNKGTKNVNTISFIRPFTIGGLCIYLDCNVGYFNDFEKALPPGEQDFSVIITRIKQIIYTQKFEGASVGIFNHNIIARDLGLTEKQNIDHTTGGKPLPITGVRIISDGNNKQTSAETD